MAGLVVSCTHSHTPNAPGQAAHPFQPLIPQAVKDVYLPNSGLWLSSYPFLDRSEFLALSLAIEREAVAGVGRAPPHYS